jgi:hypothetical protein
LHNIHTKFRETGSVGSDVEGGTDYGDLIIIFFFFFFFFFFFKKGRRLKDEKNQYLQIEYIDIEKLVGRNQCTKFPVVFLHT